MLYYGGPFRHLLLGLSVSLCREVLEERESAEYTMSMVYASIFPHDFKRLSKTGIILSAANHSYNNSRYNEKREKMSNAVPNKSRIFLDPFSDRCPSHKYAKL